MDRDFKIFQKEIKKYKDTLVLDFGRVVILRDFLFEEDDYYYVFQNLMSDIYQSNCVHGFISLKDRLNPKEYEKLLLWFKCYQENTLKTKNREII